MIVIAPICLRNPRAGPLRQAAPALALIDFCAAALRAAIATRLYICRWASTASAGSLPPLPPPPPSSPPWSLWRHPVAAPGRPPDGSLVLWELVAGDQGAVNEFAGRRGESELSRPHRQPQCSWAARDDRRRLLWQKVKNVPIIKGL